MIHLLRKPRTNFSSQLSNYIRRGKHRPQTTLQLNSLTHNFQLKHQQFYPDFDLTHRHFTNPQSLTNFHQLQCSQQTNTLSLIFKLKDMKFPSINFALQKMLNGGSRSYPIRGLIQTVRPYTMNNVSYTSTINEDYMVFNFSTPNLKDYRNLLDVYYDMLFRPLLRREDFAQLVWRYHIDLSAGRGKLLMKGELADVMVENDYYEENFIYKEILKSFFNKKNATICLQQELTQFTYQDLLQFYHQTITYQNLTLINHGDMSHEYVLSLWDEICERKGEKKDQQYQKPIVILDKDSKAQQQQHSQTKSEEEIKSSPISQPSLPKTISFQHMKPQTILMLSYKITTATQQQKALLSILSYLLFDMPQSPFMKFNTPQTPYPLLYGCRGRYFNVGVTFNSLDDLGSGERKLTEVEKEKIMLEKEKEIVEVLNELQKQKISHSLVEKCLAHLQANYYTSSGLKIIQSIIDPILFNQSITSSLNVTQLIQKLFKKYKKQTIFQNLINKFLLTNKQYICFRGYNNYQIVENKQFERQNKLAEIRKSLTDQMVKKIMNYQPPNILQDFKVLPQLKPLDLQFFQDLQPKIQKIDGVNVFYEPNLNGVKVTLKSDISDLNQQLFPFLQLFCKSFPQMGTKHMKDQAYQQILSRYINNISVRYETQKSRQDPHQMKVYLFFSIDFNDRYFEFGFSILNGLVKGWNHQNIFALSRIIQKSASQYFHSISEDVVSFHARHLAASKSPFAFFESPIFSSRSITGMAGDLRKVTNPKQILHGISYQLLSIYQTVFQKPRIELMFECKSAKKDFYTRYLQLMIKQLTRVQQNQIQGISIENFPQQRWLKYFPNFQQQLVFQCFSFPYYQKLSPAGMIFSSIVNKNIGQYSQVGGCFVYKGTLVSFLAGGRKKVLELEDYYRKIDGGLLDQAKRDIFKRFDRYRVKDWFESGISIEEARYFKQAIIATQKTQVEEVLNNYVLEVLKKGESSILSLGPRLQNYEPLMKKGWEIQRPVDDLSLNVESYSTSQPYLKLKKYTQVC